MEDTVSGMYILKDGEPVECEDVDSWAKWFQDSNGRVVKQDTVQDDPEIFVSTVFLGLDHNFSGVGLPVLWETMIFGGEHDQYQMRYKSKEDALKGHEVAVNLSTTPA